MERFYKMSKDLEQLNLTEEISDENVDFASLQAEEAEEEEEDVLKSVEDPKVQ